MNFDFDERDRRSVIGDLKSEDPEVRRLAVERVSVLPRQEAVVRLVEQLGDSNWRVRKAAIERLLASADASSALDGLISALADPENAGRRNGAIEVLVRCGGRAVPRLIEAAAEDDPDVRKLAVDGLGSIGDPRARAVLVERLRDPDANVRAAAADALGIVGGAEAARVLRETAVSDGEDQIVRLAALRGLETLGVGVPVNELLPMLDDAVLRPAALACLVFDEGEAALEVLLKTLTSSSRSTREAAMRALVRMLSNLDGGRADPLVERLRESGRAADAVIRDALSRLEDADLPTRLVLVQFLGLLASEDAVLPILGVGRDETLCEVALATLAGMGERAEAAIDAHWETLDSDLRRVACLLFGRTGGPRAGARLVEALGDPNPATRSAAASAAGSLRLSEAVEPLVLGLERAGDPDGLDDEELLQAFTEALVRVAGPEADPEIAARAVELVTSRLAGAGDDARLPMARVLGRVARIEQVALLAPLIEDPSDRLRRATVEALARIGSAEALDLLQPALRDESPLVRTAAASALAAFDGAEVRAGLRALADDPEPLVRAAALRGIGRRFLAHAEDRDETLSLLHGALSDEAPVALAALEVLREAGSASVEALLRMLARPESEVIQEAVRCMRAIGGDEVDALLPLVSHPDWSVRAEAIQALAECGRVAAAPVILRRLETEQDEFVREVMLAAIRKLEG